MKVSGSVGRLVERSVNKKMSEQFGEDTPRTWSTDVPSRPFPPLSKNFSSAMRATDRVGTRAIGWKAEATAAQEATSRAVNFILCFFYWY